MMKELRLDYPKCVLGRLLNVSASGYYAWVDRPSSRRAQEEVRLELEIRAAHKRTRQTYGPERLQRDLAEHGVRVGICRYPKCSAISTGSGWSRAYPKEAWHTLQAEEEIQGHHRLRAQTTGCG